MAGSRALLVVLVVAAVVAASAADDVEDVGQRGLSFGFYRRSCPQAESIVRRSLRSAARRDPGLIRIHFHDCFIQGCDGSVLLDNSTGGVVSERTYPPNLTCTGRHQQHRPAAPQGVRPRRLLRRHRRARRAGLRQAGTKLLSFHSFIPRSSSVSSQAQGKILYMLFDQAGGPSYRVPLGRRDGLRPAPETVVNTGLPPPSATVPALMGVVSKLGLDLTDLVAISGGHTVGIAHCSSFEDRLFPARDPTMSQRFFNHLRQTCPAKGADNTTVNDIRTPRTFDNRYYVDLVNRQGLFTSDQDLFVNATSRPLVRRFAGDQDAFFDQFVYSYVKMGMVRVLTGSRGQVRANCAFRNPPPRGSSLPWSVVETAAENDLIL